MSEPEVLTLVGSLRMKDDFYATHMGPTPPEWKFRSFEAWVLSEEGTTWTAADVRSYPDFRGTPRNCFEDALMLAYKTGWRYVEGFATGAYGLDVHHAWCVDDDGRVVDPTWEAVAREHHPDEPFPAEHVEYRGIVFRHSDAGSWMNAKDEYGIFYGRGSERLLSEGRAAVEEGWYTPAEKRAEAEKGLSKAQKRYLAEIRAKPGRRYNGRARRSLEALEAAGLIETEYDLRPHADAHGNIGSFTEVFVCHPVED